MKLSDYPGDSTQARIIRYWNCGADLKDACRQLKSRYGIDAKEVIPFWRKLYREFGQTGSVPDQKEYRWRVKDKVEPRLGSDYGVHPIGIVRVSKINGDSIEVVQKTRDVNNWGTPFGESYEVKQIVNKADLMTTEDYRYACWKGDAGSGKTFWKMLNKLND
jgi:hypothetical protein